MRKLVVSSKYNGKKLNTVLLSEFDGLTTSSLYKALRKKDIRINGVKTNQNVAVYEGDEITIFITDEYLFKTSIITKDSIIYEDENLLVANKPAGIEVTGDNSFSSLLSVFLGYTVFPCHRLDRNTSGLVLFAKNETALNILFDKFKNHEIEKHYICEVYGIPKEKHKILTDFLFKDNKKSIVYISNVPINLLIQVNRRLYFIQVELTRLELILLIMVTLFLVTENMVIMKLTKNLR